MMLEPESLLADIISYFLLFFLKKDLKLNQNMRPKLLTSARGVGIGNTVALYYSTFLMGRSSWSGINYLRKL